MADGEGGTQRIVVTVVDESGGGGAGGEGGRGGGGGAGGGAGGESEPYQSRASETSRDASAAMRRTFETSAGSRDAAGDFYHNAAMMGAVSQTLGGNPAAGAQALLSNFMMQPIYGQRRTDQLHAEMTAAHGRAAADSYFGQPGFGSRFWRRSGPRIAAAGAGLLAVKGMQMAMKDDKELDAASFSEAVSAANLSGVLGHGDEALGNNGWKHSGDRLSSTGLSRALADPFYGALDRKEQAALITSLGRNYGGTYDFHGRMVPEAARARMAGVDVGTSGQYYGMFAPGGGGVGDRDKASVVQMTKAMQGLGISSARIDKAIQTVAQNTAQMVNSGIKTDIPELTSLIAGISQTPGLSDMGARAANIGKIAQSGPMQAINLMTSASDGYEMALSLEEAAARNPSGGYGDIVGSLYNMAEHPAKQLEMYRRRADPTIMKLAYAAHGLTWDESTDAQQDLNPADVTGSLLTTRTRGIAAGRSGGGDWTSLKAPGVQRKVESSDLVLNQGSYQAAETLSLFVTSAGDSIRRFGGVLEEGIAKISNTIKNDFDWVFGGRSGAP